MKRARGSQVQSQQPSIRNFFAAKTGAQQPRQQLEDEAPTKKQKQGSDDDFVIVLDDADDSPAAAHGQGGAAAAAAPAGTSVQDKGAPAATRALPKERDAAAHGMAQAKLVTARTVSRDLGGPAEEQQQVQGRAAGRQAPAPKYTPLEQQVVALKAAHPGVLLLVEVGYKMRMFGEDAEVAAKELGIACFHDHNFMTASFPVPRLSIHVRRLVAAGHKVGVVRQTESAALKAAGDNKSAPFTRSLTGLFTAATLDAAEKADKLDEASYMEVSQELESMLGGSARSPAANYVLVVAQDMHAQQHQAPAAAVTASKAGSAAATAATAAAATGGLLGLLAVDAGSGDIAYGLGSTDSSTAAASAGTAGSSGSGEGTNSLQATVMPLEAVLLSLTPSDIVVCEPVAAATEQMLKSYMAGASRRCRLERLQPQEWKRQQQANKGRNSSTQQKSGSSAGGYLDAGLMNDLVDFFTDASSTDATAAGTSRGAVSTPSPAAAAAAGGPVLASVREPSSAAPLQFVLSLPQPVLAALAGCLAYLQPFGLSEVLRCTSSYRSLNVGGAMTLDGSALRQLEVLESGAESSPQLKGSLLHVLDRCSTAAGGRMLRRWLAAPLADRSSINDRQQAVQVLLDSITGSTGEQQQQAGSSGHSVLQQLPRWLSSTRQDLERALARVAAGTAAPAEAVGLWNRLAQVPSALKLPVKQQPAAAEQPQAADSTDASKHVSAAARQQLDLDRLSADVPSRLLVSLLAAAAGDDVARPAADVLASLDTAAAAKNDYLALFKSQEHFPEVFACRTAVSDAERHLQELLPKLAAAAGVRTLSYVTIQNQGNYLLELPAARTDVPKGWDKVCATKKVCRYHPTEVKAGMAALARAQEQLQAACGAAWTQLLRDFTAAYHAAFRAAVAAVAQLDALHGLAVVASSPGYCKPQFIDECEPQQLSISEGKHPMLDVVLDGAAVPNSMDLRWDGKRAAVITGPNMGGKSVLMRQAALIVIMAQLGSWVPASSCVLSVFDGVYCRMGASDCLMLGRSTFAEELGEASHILARATNRSLVIMDELGRGTATHDGVAIACATLSHLVSHIQCLSLFVTHYPEVASLAVNQQPSTADKQPEAPPPQSPAAAAAISEGPVAEQSAGPGPAAQGSKQVATAAAAGAQTAGNSSDGAGQIQASAGSSISQHVAVYLMSYVRQDTAPQQAAAEAAATGMGTEPSPAAAAAAGGMAAAGSSPAAEAAEAIPVITFLYKLAEGAADESFGLNVAQMAGLPGSVVQQAAVVAAQLKTRLGQQQHQHQEPLRRQKQPRALGILLEDAAASVFPAVQLTQQVCRVLRSAAGSNAQLDDLLQLQASAAQLSAELQQS